MFSRALGQVVILVDIYEGLIHATEKTRMMYVKNPLIKIGLF